MKKRYVLTLLFGLLLTASLLTGCKRGSEEEETGKTGAAESKEAKETVCVPYIELYGYELEDDADILRLGDMFLEGNCLYSVVWNSWVPDTLLILDTATGEQKKQELDTTRGQYYRSRTGYISYNYLDNRLGIYDEDFIKTGEIDMDLFEELLSVEGDKLSYAGADADGEGHLGIISEGKRHHRTKLAFFASDGAYDFSVECPEELNRFGRLIVTGGGEWYVFGEAAEGQLVLYGIDIEQKKLGEPLKNMPDAGIYQLYGLCRSGESGLYMAVKGKIYRYDTETESLEELFDTSSYGISCDQNSGFGVLDGGNFVLLNEEEGYDAASSSDRSVFVERTALTEILKEDYKPRKELILALPIGDLNGGVLQDAVLSFNKYNPDYYVTLKRYFKFDSTMEENQRLAAEFLNDLTEGRIDIVYYLYVDSNFDNLAEKGAFADLYKLMEGDGEFGRENFIPNVLKTMEYDGKLTHIALRWGFYTLAGRGEILGDYDGRWNLTALCELAAKYPDAWLVSMNGAYRDPVAVLACLTDRCGAELYNKETGECRFDSDEFVMLLKTVEQQAALLGQDGSKGAGSLGLTISSSDGGDDMRAIREGALLLSEEYFSSYYKQQELEAYAGGDIECIGYPSGKRALVYSQDHMCVGNFSANKEAAWEVIKYILQYVKGYAGGFSVIRSSFEEGLDTAMREGGGRHSVSVGNGVTVTFDREPLTGQGAELIRELAYSAALSDYDSVIHNIVLEEAGAFFAGDKSAEETAKVIQSRVLTYIQEKN